MDRDDGSTYGPPSRTINRAITVLKIINHGGPMSMMAISRAAGFSYPSTYRMVQALQHEGLVERDDRRKRYLPTALVRELSSGYQGHNALITMARPHLAALTRAVQWPVSLVTRVGPSMVVLDSTHHMTTLTFNNHPPGYALPILECASGLVYLAHLDAEDRTALLRGLERYPGGNSRLLVDGLLRGDEILEQIVVDGYAAQARNRHTLNPGKTSSIAVPVLREGAVVGAISLIFFSNAMSLSEAAALYLPKLQEAASALAAPHRGTTRKSRKRQ